MATLVIDIETTAMERDAFDEAQWGFLHRDVERISEESLREARRAEIGQQLNLYPLTARVACVAMQNVQTKRGKVLSWVLGEGASGETAPAGPDTAVNPEGVDSVVFAEEAALLKAFWELAKCYEQVVTFNGRGFDVPFLYLRSAQLRVPISRKDWLGYRFTTEPHCDLADQLTFYGVSGRDGAARRFNLDFYCKAFGVPSPKSHGVTGADVNRLLAEGRHREVAMYCYRDVEATAELYRIWREYLAGIK